MIQSDERGVLMMNSSDEIDFGGHFRTQLSEAGRLTRSRAAKTEAKKDDEEDMLEYFMKRKKKSCKCVIS